ncbi:redox virion protein [Squirrelpox virus]|uniref:Redox virion protein n=1 Tax=Squirrelpox virus TaxID=240426 RepID=U3UBD5_9POXV|nr:redox virion protein [Squirrelpox virus]CCD83273.1 redox virion protein [Squirrelpox virus]
MSAFDRYEVHLAPPRRCTRCAETLTAFLREDRNHIRMILESQPDKLLVLRRFLSHSRNKELNIKILDEEIARVLT